MNNHHGSGWIRRLVPRIYELVHEIWMYRISIVHEAVEEKLNRQELKKLNGDIEKLYLLSRTNVRPTHRNYFEEGLTATLARTVREKNTEFACWRLVQIINVMRMRICM